MKLFGALLVCLVPLTAAPQLKCALGPGASSYKPSEDQKPSSDTMQLAGRVNAAMKLICGSNCPTIAVYRNATAPNAMLIAESGIGKLVYAPQFFATVFDGFGDDGILAIIAHEVAHPLDETIGAAWVKDSWPAEVRADSWAACAIARMGLTPSGLRAALGALAKYPSPAHPGWNVRLPALREGYTHCGGDGSQFDKKK